MAIEKIRVHRVTLDTTAAYNGPRLHNGSVTLPDGGPGLGLVLDPEQFGEPEAVYR